MNSYWKTTVLLIVILFLIPYPALSQKTSDGKDQPPEEIFTKGRLSLQLVSGVINSITKLPKGSPVLGYAQTNVRVGWMAQSPGRSKSFWRGNWEVIGEVSNSFIYKGSGTYIGGVTALLRYNFVQPGWRFIPFVQVGAGIVYNDIYKDETQKAVGQAIEFTPQCSLGLRYLINKNWSVDGEAMFHHISNAGMADRNRSLNALGGFVGVTYFFDTLWKPSEDNP
jgi:lipid A 3-O-deacylase